MYNSVAINVLGTIGTVLWCIQLVPQIIRNYIVKDLTGFPPSMMFLWAASGVPFAIYFIGSDGSIPLRVQPELFTFFCVVSWFQTLYYPPVKMSMKKIILFVGSFVLISTGLELGFILWLRPVYRGGKHWVMLIFGILASILLAVGLFPPYFELAKRQGRVVGINFVFLGLDSLGAWFSLASVMIGQTDAMSISLYAIIIGLEAGIFLSQALWYITIGRSILRVEKDQKNQKDHEDHEDQKNQEDEEDQEYLEDQEYPEDQEEHTCAVTDSNGKSNEC